MLPHMDQAATMQVLRKHGGAHGIEPNMRDYARERASFTWAGATEALDGLPSGHGINIAHEAVDRHVLAHRADHLAVRWLGKDLFALHRSSLRAIHGTIARAQTIDGLVAAGRDVRRLAQNLLACGIWPEQAHAPHFNPQRCIDPPRARAHAGQA